MSRGETSVLFVAGDMGNAQCKGVCETGSEFVFPHALHQLTNAQLAQRRARGDYDLPEHYTVNGIVYSIGDKAIRDGAGAVRMGEGRYEELYYGTLAAIMLFNLIPAGNGIARVHWFGSHTPKDIEYKDDLIAAVKNPREWVVDNQGSTKRFRVVEAHAFDEPSGAYRHATLGDVPGTYRGLKVLRTGTCLIIDLGGFTTALSVAYDGKVDYDSARSHLQGVLQVLADFERLIRTKYRRALKGTNALDALRLRTALRTGSYQAGGLGNLDVKDCAEEAANPLLRAVEELVQLYGGIASVDSILLTGGGAGLFEAKLRARLGHRSIHVSEENRERIHLSTALGGMKILKNLRAKGLL